MHISNKLFTNTFLFLISLTLMIGCDTSVDPFNERSGGYSIYGSLNITENNNYIRIRNTNHAINLDSTKNLNLDVTLKNMNNGVTQSLEDSIVKFNDVYTHNYKSTMSIIPDTKYKIILQPPEGGPISSTATTPSITEVNISPKGEDCQTFISITFEPVKAARYIDIFIGFRDGGEFFRVPIAGSRSSPGGNQIVAGFTPQGIIDRVLNSGSSAGDSVRCYQLDSPEFTVDFLHYGPDFFENASSDSVRAPEGIGQFGGLYENAVTFDIDTTRLCRPYCP